MANPFSSPPSPFLPSLPCFPPAHPTLPESTQLHAGCPWWLAHMTTGFPDKHCSHHGGFHPEAEAPWHPRLAHVLLRISGMSWGQWFLKW